MFNFDIINNDFLDLNKEIIKKIFKIVSNKIDKKQLGIINLVFVDDNTIKELNSNYRKKNKVTDVLSFHYYTDFSSLKKEDIAGEIIFNFNRIKVQSEEYGFSKEKEFYILLIHSILHILGYDHEEDLDYTIMNKFEKEIYKEVFEK